LTQPDRKIEDDVVNNHTFFFVFSKGTINYNSA